MLEQGLLEGNKYFKWYWSICNRAKDRILSPDIYIERHHIYPKSIYGQNQDLVKLTAKEHYIVHLLLWWGLRFKYGTKDVKTRSMAYSFKMMNVKSIFHKNQRYNSKLFSFLKIAFNEGNKNKKVSEETILKMRKTWSLRSVEQKENTLKKLRNTLASRTRDEIEEIKIKRNPGVTKFKSEDHKRKIAIALTGKKQSEERKEKISKTRIDKKVAKGVNNPMYGKCAYDIWVEKYGKENANIKQLDANKKNSESNKGKTKNRKIKPCYKYTLLNNLTGELVISYGSENIRKILEENNDSMYKLRNDKLKFFKVIEIKQVRINKNYEEI